MRIHNPFLSNNLQLVNAIQASSPGSDFQGPFLRAATRLHHFPPSIVLASRATVLVARQG